VVMGGAVFARGNSWERAAEYNFYCDPEAAAVVLEAWHGLTLIPWETALAYGLQPEQVEQIAQGSSPQADLFRRTIRTRFVEQSAGRRVLSVPDPLAMAVALEPEIVQRSEMRYIEIELGGRLTRGQTVVDWYNLTGRVHNVEIVHEVDRQRFWELMRATFA